MRIRPIAVMIAAGVVLSGCAQDTSAETAAASLDSRQVPVLPSAGTTPEPGAEVVDDLSLDPHRSPAPAPMPTFEPEAADLADILSPLRRGP